MNRGSWLGTLCCLLVSWLSASASASASAQTAQQAIDRGAELYREGRFEEASEAFAEAVALDPGSLAVWESLGWAHRKAGHAEKALEVWLRVLKVDPNRAALWNQAAAIDMENERWDAAARSLRMSLRVEPGESHVRSRLAMVLESAGRLDEAAEAYEELVRRDPGSLTAVKRLSSFYERAGQDAKALEVLEGASKRLPHLEHILRIHIARLEARRADRAFARGDYSDAVEGYREAVGSNPRDAGYLENLGWAHRRAGELEEAVSIWRRALERKPNDAELLRHLGDALRESGETEEARTLYSKAWDIAPGSDAAVPFRLAESALAAGREDEAVAWSKTLLALPRADAIWSERVAGLYARFDAPDPGITVFRDRSRQTTAPGATAAAESRLHAVAGMKARQAQELDRAVASYREALRLDATNRVALRDLGWTLWLRSDWDGCAVSWERLAALDPDDPDALNLLTHLYLYRRRYDDAIRTARASLALRSDQPEQSLKLARALHWSEHYAEARTLAETLARDYPEELDIQRFWAELLMQYHDFERGLSQWQHAMTLGADDARARFYYVKSLYETGRYDTALAKARRFAAAPPPEPEPHENLLRLLADDALLRGERREAGGWLRKLVEKTPEKVERWLELADLEADLGSPESALATLDEARRWHPDSVALATARANLLRREGRSGEAFAIYRGLAEVHPENREVFYGLLQTASETERNELALRVLDSNRSTFLKPYEVELERARLLYATGKGGEARELLEQAALRARDTLVVPILLYHGLGEHPRTPSMPVEKFDSQLRALSSAGYQTLSLPELDRITRGELPMPGRPIVITFDDARIDSFVLADPVLERYGMKATMFVPTGLTLDGHPFFADWELMERYAATGRWDLQAHGHHAHDLIAIDAEGTEGSFLVNRMWLADEGRLETEDEYLARIENDYGRVKQEIESRVPGAEVVGYAFPFSEAGQENTGNYPEASKVNEAYLGHHYRFGLIQDANGYNEVVADANGFLKRFSVPRDFGGEELLRHLARESPRARAMRELAKIQMWTGLYGASRETWASLVAESPVLGAEAAFYLAAIDFQQGRLRSARRHIDEARRAEPESAVRPDERAKLERRITWEESIRIEPRFDLFEDSAARTNRSQALGFSVGALAPLELRASVGTASYEEESVGFLETYEGQLGLRVQASRHLRFDAGVRQSNARTSGPDSTNYWGVVGIEGDRAELSLRAGENDVETLRARLDGVVLRGYQLQHLLRLTPRFWVHLDGRYGEYSDGNRREDLALRLTFRPWSAPEWRIGVSGGWTDSLEQRQSYYTPAELRFGRGLVRYSRSFSSGWNLDASVELGWARDTLRGDRFTAHARGQAVQAWTDRIRSSVGWSFSSSPGYQSWTLGLGVHYGFTSPVELGPAVEPH